ncbi:MAG: chromosome segregation protein SMC [Phycisphaerales bacterium]|nr:chromosome segregation protein SMC [Phycisphaerales bacterium]
MRLARLTLCGFKSFADRTEFAFGDAVTGIVGPNGCGKSNVVDAIKWVLGERSSKSLRGKEMIDVIFAGSAGRKPSGMASVTLTFENPVRAPSVSEGIEEGTEAQRHEGTKEEGPEAQGRGGTEQNEEEVSEVEFVRDGERRRALPIDADVVEVERRLYRDGTSRYLINQKRARLRDIRDLFLDTGIGADAYSIIEQGKVDAMLLASPQERRTIFEEAAGVAKYKQRRVEAQRKLERALANLALSREQLASTERRLRIAKGQAARARRFRELDGELRAWRAAIAFDQYDDVRQRLEGLTSRLAELEGTRRDAGGVLAALEQAKQEAEVARHELFAEHRALEERRLGAVHAEQQAAQRKQMTERALAEAAAQAEADRGRLGGVESRLNEALGADEAQGQGIAALAERLAEADRALQDAAQRRAGAMSAVASGQAALAERRAAAAEIDRQVSSLRGSIEADRTRAEGIREALSRLAEKAAATEGHLAGAVQAESDAAAGTARSAAAVAGLEVQHEEAEDAARSLGEDRRGLAARVMELEQRHARLDGRRQTLADMERDRVGLADAVRDVLMRRDTGRGFAGVVAPVAELLDVAEQDAAPVEAALGADLQALVLAPGAALPSAEELGSLTGRVTFLSADGEAGVRAGVLTESHPSLALRSLIESGGVTPLRSLVRARGDVPLDGLLDRLVGGTYLVLDLEGAVLLSVAAPGARFVTRDGRVLDGAGRLRAGPMSESADGTGMLRRHAELAALEQEVEGLGGSLRAERRTLAAADAEASSLSARLADLRGQLAAAQRTLAAEHSRLERARADAARLGREGAELAEEARDQAERLERLERDRAELTERAEKLARLRSDEARAAAEAEDSLAALRAAAEASGDEAAAARVESGRLGEQVAAARREHRRLRALAEQMESERRELSRLCDHSAHRMGEHRAAIEQAAAEIGAAAAEARRLGVDAAAASVQLADAGERARDLGERAHAAREHAQHVERDWHSLEVSRREVEVKREGLEDRGTEELALDLAFEYADYRAVMADGRVVRIDPAAAGASVEGLRVEIKKLGSVNMEAIDEEAQLAQRNGDLIRQVADIDDAAAKLGALIERLNLASRERFGQVFATIQEHFAGAHGMFRKLFGGGRAEVRLMPLVKEIDGQRVETGETDLLESGIEVIAKPPGKEPRSISQLSGGEKTLTAVALLLSIFRSKPSCFCILDEVDAALDDANVGRYCGVVREFTSHSHFIVITHNKKTMQASDRLYGITMQERGVSTRVSVKFDEVGKDGTIETPSASGGAATVREAQEKPVAGVPGSSPDRTLLRRALAGMRENTGATTTAR